MNLLFKLTTGLLVIAISGALSLNFVANQFGGYDLSPLIDLVWRFSNEEVPGVDFINTFPPLFLILGKAAALEPTWFSLTWVNILFTLLTYLLIAAGSKSRDLNWWISSALILCIPLVYTNHIWHSSVSQLVAIAFYFHISNYIKQDSHKSLDLYFILLVSGLVVLSKQNLGPMLVLFTIVFILIYERSRSGLLLLSYMVAGIIIGVLASFLYLNYSLDGFVYIYTSVLGRSKVSLDMYFAFSRMLTNYPFIVLMALLIFLSRRQIADQLRRFGDKGEGYDLVILAVSAVPIFTDWDAKANNLSLPIFVIANMIFGNRNSNMAQRPYGIIEQNSALFFLVVCTFMVAAIGGFTRERMKHVGDFYDSNATEIGSKYFEGLKASEKFSCVISEIHKFQSAYDTKNVYFGPRVEFGYQLIGQHSPYKMPLWMHPGTSYKQADESLVIDTFINSNFDGLVFLKDDRTRMPRLTLDFIEKNYTKLQGFSCADVYFR